MTQPSLTFVQAVRDFLDLDLDATSKYSDATIGSNIRAATAFLERATGRLFGDYTATTRKFTTNGAVYLTIPGLRTATSVTMTGTALAADTTYWLIPDEQQTGVSTGIQLQGFNERLGGPGYLHSSEWFDRGLDLGRSQYTSAPNDLVIVGDWGYTSANTPEAAIFACKVQAAFYTKYPDAVLASSIATANDGSIDMNGWPLPVQEFVRSWSIRQGVAAT